MNLEVYGFTYAGKPLFSSCNDSDVSLTFFGTLCAITSKVASLLSDYKEADSLRYITAGRHQFICLERGPLCYFGISKNGDSPLVIYKVLSNIHLQVVSILTRSVERILLRRPSYDVQNLLGGTHSIMNKLMDNLSGYSGLLDNFSYETLPLPQSTRSLLTKYFTDFDISNILCTLLVVSNRVAMITLAKRILLDSSDIAIVVNTVNASQSLKQQENWTPICLPTFNDQAFTYAYIHYIEPEIGIVCISSKGDQEQFHAISKRLDVTITMMKASNCLNDLQSSLMAIPLEFPSGGTKNCEILHVLYHSNELGQFFSSAFKNSAYGYTNDSVLSAYRMVSELLYNTINRKISVSFECINVYVEFNTEYSLYLATVPWTDITTELVNTVVEYISQQYPFLFITKIPTINK